MAYTLNVYLRRSVLPTTAQWQAALDAEQAPGVLPLRLEAGLEPASHRGFWPAQWQGQHSGFEFALAALDSDDTDEADWGHRADAIATLRTEADGPDLPATLAAAVALARACDGVLVDPQEGDIAEGAVLIGWLQDQLALLADPLPEPVASTPATAAPTAPQRARQLAAAAWLLQWVTLLLLVLGVALPALGSLSGPGGASVWLFRLALLGLAVQALVLLPLRWLVGPRQPLLPLLKPTAWGLLAFVVASLLNTGRG